MAAAVRRAAQKSRTSDLRDESSPDAARSSALAAAAAAFASSASACAASRSVTALDTLSSASASSRKASAKSGRRACWFSATCGVVVSRKTQTVARWGSRF